MSEARGRRLAQEVRDADANRDVRLDAPETIRTNCGWRGPAGASWSLRRRDSAGKRALSWGLP